MSDLISIKIAICDDDPKWHQEISSFCSAFFENKSANYELFSYYSGEEIINEKDKNIDLLFLDIEMGELDGLAAMKQIENMPNIHRIIFVSSHPELMMDAFGYKTIGFVPKPFEKVVIEKKLDELYYKILDDKIINFSDFNGNVIFHKSDIVYIEAHSNYITIYTKDDEKVIACTLKKCETLLGGLPFIRIHKSYVVNLNHVKDITNGSVGLINGMNLTIGRIYKDKVKAEYQKYLIKELHS